MIFNKLSLGGKAKYNYLLIKDGIANENEKDLMDNPTIIPNWDSIQNTTFFAPFTENLVSSLIGNLESPLIAWNVYKQKENGSKLDLVATVKKERLFIVDYLVANHERVKYFVFPITESELGVSLKSDSIVLNTGKYSLTSIKEVNKNTFVPDQIWNFSLNVAVGEMLHTTDKTFFQTHSKFPKVSVGESDYLTIPITCLLGDIDCNTGEYVDSVEKYNAWLHFVTSAELCIYKDVKGLMRLVSISKDDSASYMECDKTPLVINFTLVEMGDLDDITVYSEDDTICSM